MRNSAAKAFFPGGIIDSAGLPSPKKIIVPEFLEDNIRNCPECGFESLMGMPGGRDATCKNCGYKDPCCYD